MSKISAVLSKLSKAYSQAIVNVEEVGTVKRIYLESPQLNFMFGGGFGLGRIYEFSGPESGGKSTLATYIGGELQKKYTDRPVVVYVDFEYSFDKKYANTLGLSTSDEDFILLRPMHGEEATTIIGELINQLPVGLVIWDSAAATPSISQVEDPNKASFGGGAKVFSNGLKYLNPFLSRNNTSLIIINQERANVGVIHGPDFKTAGGYAIKYYSSWRGRITRIDDIKEKGLTVGIVSKVRNTKNKIGIPKREAELELRFAAGFDSDGEYVRFLVDLGIVKQGGAWFSNADWGFKGQGKDSILVYLKENPELFESVKNSVNAMLSGETVLDADRPDEEEDEDDLPLREVATSSQPQV